MNEQQKQIAEALRETLPKLAHRFDCCQIRPAEEWAEHGSVDFSDCGCIVSKVRAAIAILAQQEAPSMENPERRALGNVYMLAKRMRRREGADKEVWDHIIRFCIEGGCKSSILREQETPSPERTPCACRKALRVLFDSCSTTHPDWGADICEPDGNAMSQACAALASPCSCDPLPVSDYIQAGIAAYHKAHDGEPA